MEMHAIFMEDKTVKVSNFFTSTFLWYKYKISPLAHVFEQESSRWGRYLGCLWNTEVKSLEEVHHWGKSAEDLECGITLCSLCFLCANDM